MFKDNKIQTHCIICGSYAWVFNDCDCLECEYIGITNKLICCGCNMRLKGRHKNNEKA